MNTEQDLANGLSLAAINALGFGPTQFSLITGNPYASVSMVDASPYVEDDWRMRPNITVSYGLRLETQDHISDHADLAPRLGVAWGLGGTKAAPKIVLRAGWGIFYDRFPPNLVLQADRQNGVNEQELIISNPNFFCPNSLAACPAINTLQSTSVPTIYQIAPNLHAPMLMQTAVSVERQLTKAANVSISFLNSRGWRQLVTITLIRQKLTTWRETIQLPSTRDRTASQQLWRHLSQRNSGKHLSIRIGRNLPAESVSAQYHDPRRRETLAERILLAELRR